MQNLNIDGDRLWCSLAEMARIGATEAGGVCRLALTDLDRQARDLFAQWCRDAGCQIRIDAMGNIFARREGTEPDRPVVMTGSHLDTQPTGGRFDGVYGVLAGLEVLRTLNDHEYRTKAPIEVAVWTNEEGSRFPPAMVGSGVFAGVFSLDYGLSRADPDGTTIGAALDQIGYAGSIASEAHEIDAFFEAHIEQGPILEAEGRTIGVVTGAQGQRWYEISLTGQEAHAGPTPMSRRRDALVGAARLVVEVNRIGHAYQPDACATVGLLNVYPNSRNTIPGRVFFTVDLRHPDEDRLARMGQELQAAVRATCEAIGLSSSAEQIWHSPAVRFDPECIDAVRRAVERTGMSSRDIISGAGHDACYLNRVAPTAMIFIPCEEGISHNEQENASKEDVGAGAQILLRAMLERADREFCRDEAFSASIV